MNCQGAKTDTGDKKRQLMAMRAQLDSLSHQTKDIYQCIDHLHLLQNSIAQMQLAKSTQASQFAMKHQDANRTIGYLKGQLQRLQNQLKLKTEGDNKGKLSQLKQRLAQVQCDIQKLISQIESYIADRQTLSGQIQKLKNQIQHIQQQTSTIMIQIKNLRKDNDTVFRRRAQAQHFIRDLDHQTSNLQQQIQSTKQKILLKKDTGKNKQLIQELHKCISNSQANVKKLQGDQIQFSSNYDRMKYQMAHLTKNINNQSVKNNMLRQKIMHGQNLLTHLTRQNQQSQNNQIDQEIEKLRKENANLQEQLVDYKTQNNQLANQLQLMAQDDDKIRLMLDRRPLANRSRQKVSLSYMNTRSSIQNPYFSLR